MGLVKCGWMGLEEVVLRVRVRLVRFMRFSWLLTTYQTQIQ